MVHFLAAHGRLIGILWATLRCFGPAAWPLHSLEDDEPLMSLEEKQKPSQRKRRASPLRVRVLLPNHCNGCYPKEECKSIKGVTVAKKKESKIDPGKNRGGKVLNGSVWWWALNLIKRALVLTGCAILRKFVEISCNIRYRSPCKILTHWQILSFSFERERAWIWQRGGWSNENFASRPSCIGKTLTNFARHVWILVKFSEKSFGFYFHWCPLDGGISHAYFINSHFSFPFRAPSLGLLYELKLRCDGPILKMGKFCRYHGEFNLCKCVRSPSSLTNSGTSAFERKLRICPTVECRLSIHMSGPLC